MESSWGNQQNMSQCIVANMYSADHYQKEVSTNMTCLVDILRSVKDNIFTVQFHTKPIEQLAVQAL